MYGAHREAASQLVGVGRGRAATQASPSVGEPELGRDARDRALGEGRALGRERPLDVRSTIVELEGEPRAEKPASDSTMACSSSMSTPVGADPEGVVGREAQDGHVRPVPARGVERRRIARRPAARAAAQARARWPSGS